MIVAVCIDDNMGMLFFGKRQSRDKKVVEDFIRSSAGGKAYIRNFSKKLFDGKDVIIDDNCLSIAGENDWCFIENQDINSYASRISKIVIYKWNRDYPYDFTFKMPEGFTLEKSSEFTGNSHEKITREEYVK